jgi:hypothetical protein
MSLIRKDNVEKIMDAALVMQGDNAEHKLLEDFLRQLARDWSP